MALPILNFLIARHKEFDANFEYREGSPYSASYFEPLQFITQPVSDDIDQTLLNQSLKRILGLGSPDSFDEDFVDNIVENTYTYRFVGNKSVGTGRMFFVDPVDRDYLTGALTFSSKAGYQYTNIEPVSITSSEMAINVEDGVYYISVPVIAVAEGTEYNIDKNELVTVDGDTDVIKVDNPVAFSDGLPRETNTQYIQRNHDSIGARDQNTHKGINGVLNERFPGQLQEIIPVGMGDQEMMRDIVFNTHIGGYVDIYVRPVLSVVKEFEAKGLIFDRTRQVPYKTQLELPGVAWQPIGYPYIDRTLRQPVVSSVVDESPAAILTVSIPDLGIDLSSAEWMRIQVDSRSVIHIRVAGVSPAATKRNEIANNLNAALGFTFATVLGNKVLFRSPTSGFGSQIVFTVPVSPKTDATLTLFPTLPGYPTESIVYGTYPVVYTENFDYELSDEDGEIKRLSGGTISDGQLVDVDFDYNPLSIDVGNLVPLEMTSSGIVTKRGIRPGREDITITDLAFLDIIKIETIDPDTGEVTGTAPLNGSAGFGMGGFGLGPFGIGSSADYRFIIMDPHTRFSAFENALIAFKPDFFGLSVRVTYKCSPKVAEVHAFVLTDGSRVVSDTALVKNVIPAYISAAFRVRVDATNSQVPDDTAIIAELSAFINQIRGEQDENGVWTVRLEKSDLVKILNKYSDYVDTTVTMTARVVCNDGSIQVYEDKDIIAIDQVELAGDAENVATPKIVRFYADTITLARI